LKQTPLTEKHRELGARLVEFFGWEMPIQYTSVLEEHRAVRAGVGIFDLCHMGELELKGPGALATVDLITSNDPKELKVGEIQYTCLTNEKGGIIDDILVYRTEDGFLLVVNASNTAKDVAWIEKHLQPDTEFIDHTDDLALIAVQGPKSAELVEELLAVSVADIKNYTFFEPTYAGEKILVSRTGYTGEDGFELYIPNALAEQMWDEFMAKGEKFSITPVGLGARDTLRLEARMPLYGNDLNETITPLEAGLGRFVKLDKGEFVGGEVLAAQKEAGVAKRLVAFVVKGRGIPRKGYTLTNEDGEEIGEVTSGTHSPTLNYAIGMGYVQADQAKAGTKIQVMVRNKGVAAEIIRGRFLS